jgi:signal transduction histidine kinase/class 3 adenylate cyclase
MLLRFRQMATRLPLRVVSTVPFVLQLVGTVAIVMSLSFVSSQRAVRDLSDRLSGKVADQIDEHLEHYLTRPHLMHRSLAAAIANGNLDSNNFEALQRQFWADVQVSESIDYIFMGTDDGRFIGVQTYPDGRNALKFRTAATAPNREIYELDANGQRANFLKAAPYDPRDRPWYVAARGRRRQTWSPIYTSADLGALQITPATPVYGPDGQFRGVLGTNLILSQIDRFLRTLDIGKTGKAFIFERSGNMVASSTEELPLIDRGPDQEPDRRHLFASEDPTLRRLGASLQRRAGHSDVRASNILATLQKPLLLDFEVDGDRQRAWITPLDNLDGLSWLVVVVVPEADFMAAITRQNQLVILLAIAAVLLAIAAGLRTSRWVTDPILRLNQSAKRMAAGRWDEPIMLDRGDEVGELATSFNQMAAQLRRSFEELERQNQDLKQLDGLKDEFLANTSHELRTPLNGIIGIAESMLDGATGPMTELQERNLWIVARSGRRLSNLVNDILDFSKLRHHTIALDRKPVNVGAVADLVVEVSRVLVGVRELVIENQVPLDLPAAWADEGRLQQIFYNLVGNGVKFTERGQVSVSAQFVPIAAAAAESSGAIAAQIRQEGGTPIGHLEITVLDTGIGIGPDRRDRIFEAFEQGDGSTARRYGGTGLGLAVTRQLVELHGGRIWVESAEGLGSRFSFSLPAVAETEMPEDDGANGAEHRLTRLMDKPETMTGQTTASQTMTGQMIASQTITGQIVEETGSPDQPLAPPALRREDGGSGDGDGVRLLIVDDEPINLQVLENHLSFHRYLVTRANSGPEALAILGTETVPFDLILLDVMMPQMSGYEVCKRIRDRFPPHRLPIIMLTAKNQISDLIAAFQCGANDYLTKPFIKDELLTRIKTHVRLARISTSYQRFVPSEYLEFLNRESITDVKLGDHVSREMAVMFSDIRSFTPLAESMTPDESFRFINEYLGRVSPEIRRHRGIIVKYLGDGVMAVFPKCADDAVRAAIAELEKVTEYNQDRAKIHQQPIAIGIGLHVGPMMVGIVGEAGRMQGDALSDTVNLTARLEGLTKYYGVALLISESVRDRLADPHAYDLRPLDRAVVKGRSEPILIYEVINGERDEGVRHLKVETLDIFTAAWNAYQAGQFEAARAQFAAVLHHNPGDRTAAMYVRRIDELLVQESAIAPHWDGIWHFTSK